MKKLLALVLVAAVAAPSLLCGQGTLRQRLEERRAARRARENGALSDSAAGAADTGPLTGRLASRIRTITQDGGRLDWSTSRDLIAFDRLDENRYYRVWMMNPDGSGQRCLTCGKERLPGKHEGNPAWHPSGRYLVFQAQNSYRGLGRITDFFSNPGAGVNNDLWVMDSEGNQVWQLTRVPNRVGGVLHPHFSPNGQMLLWAERTSGGGGMYGQWEMKLARFSPGGAPSISDVKTLKPGNAHFYETHGFSPDNRKIYFSSNMEGQSELGIDLYVMDLDSGRTTNLTRTPNEWDEHAQLSPDGKYIVWMTDRNVARTKNPNDLKTDLWIMRSDGTGQQRLTYFNDPSHPEAIEDGVACGDSSWGPDGRRVAAYVITSIKRLEGRIVMIDLDRQY